MRLMRHERAQIKFFREHAATLEQSDDPMAKLQAELDNSEKNVAPKRKRGKRGKRGKRASDGEWRAPTEKEATE